MHGGAKGSGAPIGNQNALKAGLHTAEVRALNASIRNVLKTGREQLE